MLILPIERKWLNMILSGEKKDEYREIKPSFETPAASLPHLVLQQVSITVMALSGYIDTI